MSTAAERVDQGVFLRTALTAHGVRTRIQRRAPSCRLCTAQHSLSLKEDKKGHKPLNVCWGDVLHIGASESTGSERASLVLWSPRTISCSIFASFIHSLSSCCFGNAHGPFSLIPSLLLSFSLFLFTLIRSCHLLFSFFLLSPPQSPWTLAIATSGALASSPLR